MKSKYSIIIFAFVALGVLASCSDNYNAMPKISNVPTKTIGNESEALLTFFEQSGNYINQKTTPNTISPDEVYANLNRWLVVDLRPKEDYVAGHIDGAVNVEPNEVLKYFSEKTDAGNYEKIVFVCHSGQKAGYVAGALRLLGYGNVYSMKWGMSSWDKASATDKWQKNSSSAYVSKLEMTANPRGAKGAYPKIATGKTKVIDILQARAEAVLANSDFLRKFDEVIADPSKYYIVNYWSMDDYNKGHLPGATVYPPKASLTRETFLSTLPTDKPILVYCYTGQHAAYVVAYLRILGYDAYSLAYGANAFMNSKLEHSHAFSVEQIRNYPLVQGELPSLAPVAGETTAPENNAPAQTPVVAPGGGNKPKKKTEGGGC